MRFTAYYPLETIENVVYDCLDKMEKDGILDPETNVDIWQWDFQTYQVFLEAEEKFTLEDAKIVEKYIHENLHKRILVSVLRKSNRVEADKNTI
jgi:hypothetical protein